MSFNHSTESMLKCEMVSCQPTATHGKYRMFLNQPTKNKHVTLQGLLNHPQCNFDHMAVGQHQWYHFGVGAPPMLVYFSGDGDVHWGYGVLTHSHIELA